MHTWTGNDVYPAREKELRIACKAMLMERVDACRAACGGDIERCRRLVEQRMGGMRGVLRLVMRGDPVMRIRRYLLSRRSETPDRAGEAAA